MKVAQCWDDGLETDIPLIEIFRRYGAKATFNLNPGRFGSKRQNCWKFEDFMSRTLAAAEVKSVYEGFTLASHGMFHLDPVKNPLPVFLKDALDARKWIEDLFQQPVDGYAWPCGIYTEESAAALKENGFIYGRTTRDAEKILPAANPLILSASCRFRNPDFRRIFDKARKSCGAFYFWGHSCELKDDPAAWKAFEENIKWLSEQPDVEWCTVSELVKSGKGI